MDKVDTRILIVSDTRSKEWIPAGSMLPNEPVDVAIHCGDLTAASTIDELKGAIEVLKRINAPLKIVVPGDSDFALDLANFKRIIEWDGDTAKNDDQSLFSSVVKANIGAYGNYRDARKLFVCPLHDCHDAMRAMRCQACHGIVLLADEQTRQFDIPNGARLNVYGSPFTPSETGIRGFTYREGYRHEFTIEPHVDVVVTHGPPRGFHDGKDDATHAGCVDLYRAIRRARPTIHCFGHNPQDWGEQLCDWGPATSASSSSCVLELVDISGPVNGKVYRVEHGRHTLFINAAMQRESHPALLGYVATITLPRTPAEEGHNSSRPPTPALDYGSDSTPESDEDSYVEQRALSSRTSSAASSPAQTMPPPRAGQPSRDPGPTDPSETQQRRDGLASRSPAPGQARGLAHHSHPTATRRLTATLTLPPPRAGQPSREPGPSNASDIQQRRDGLPPRPPAPGPQASAAHHADFIAVMLARLQALEQRLGGAQQPTWPQVPTAAQLPQQAHLPPRPRPPPPSPSPTDIPPTPTPIPTFRQQGAWIRYTPEDLQRRAQQLAEGTVGQIEPPWSQFQFPRPGMPGRPPGPGGAGSE